MKVIGKIVRVLIAVPVMVLLIVVGSFTAVFFVSKDKPEDIYILNYAFVVEQGEDKKTDMWFVEKTQRENIEHGDNVVYYDGEYKSANAMLGYDGRLIFFDSDNLEAFVTVEDDMIVGKTLALWQQK